MYTCSDIISRFYRMNDETVVHPMGWDSFGLPAEKAAIERSLSPSVWTYSNIDRMKHQLEGLSFQFDWREATSDSSFYKWTQWLFIQLFKHNLVYKSLSHVNWDPVDKTVLADEQVDEEGRSWRSNAKVEKRLLRQWSVKVNAYLKDIYESSSIQKSESKDDWSEVLSLQKPWIGQPSTYIFYLPHDHDSISVICDYPEFFLSENCAIKISTNHWLASVKVANVINPFNGKPIIVNYVNDSDTSSTTHALLMHPTPFISETKRAKVLDICKKQTHLGGYMTSKNFRDWVVSRQRYWGTPIPIIICVNCGPQTVDETDLPVLLPNLKDLNHLNCESMEGEEAQVPTNRLSKIAPPDWIQTVCPKCHNLTAKRETDTFDTFLDSSWYFLRYASSSSDEFAFDVNKNRNPVWAYLGGAEHARGHLLYARFIYKFLKDKGYLVSNYDEPFARILIQGLVIGKTIKVNGKYINNDDYNKLKKEKDLKDDQVEITMEKMSKSKHNGVDPLTLVERFGIDATRLCVLGVGQQRSFREWKGATQEYVEIITFLRRLLLCIDHLNYIYDINNEKPKAPVIRRFNINYNNDRKSVSNQLSKLTRERNRMITYATNAIKVNFSPGHMFKQLQTFFYYLRKQSLIPQIAVSNEYQRFLADFLIMLCPLAPHISEECWAGFKTVANEDLKNYYSFDKLLCQQKWPKSDLN